MNSGIEETPPEQCVRCQRKTPTSAIKEDHHLYCVCHQLSNSAHHNGIPGPLALSRLCLHIGKDWEICCNKCKNPYTGCSCYA